MTNKITDQELSSLKELTLKAQIYKSESEKLVLQCNLLQEQAKSTIYGLYLKYKLDKDLFYIDIDSGEIKEKEQKGESK